MCFLFDSQESHALIKRKQILKLEPSEIWMSFSQGHKQKQRVWPLENNARIMAEFIVQWEFTESFYKGAQAIWKKKDLTNNFTKNLFTVGTVQGYGAWKQTGF